MSSRPGPMARSGVHKPLEDAANEFLRQHLSKITRHQDKSDILTPWKEQDRRSRELYVSSGTPDPALRRGMFHREWNNKHDHLNSVQAQAPGKRMGHGPNSNTWDSE